MNSNVLKLSRALLVLISLVLGFLSALYFKWVTESNDGKSSFFLDGVIFSDSENKIKFTDAINRACSFSEAYKINDVDAISNQPFAFFFEGRNKDVDPTEFCNSMEKVITPSKITQSLIIICQILILIISGVSNTRIIQRALDAVTLIKSNTGIDFRFSVGFYVAVLVIIFPIGISYTYWKEGIFWHNIFEQDRLQWQVGSNNQQTNTENTQYTYIQVPTNFNSLMGGLQSPTDMAREIERKELNEQ
ncbi:hypothetical protein FG386_000779 [Cryptosporidium ryanae]|uniref:uncharacterized protein n=1 Tax=Cryptosporidium ryanae TaxID=515981 RepID=UPI00351A025A|nr:hypothetical protein FG386_000779 [Cryptosporidium ryanae]